MFGDAPIGTEPLGGFLIRYWKTNMAASFNDMNVLRQDAIFVGRVRVAIILNSISVANEGWISNHRERQTYCVLIMNGPDAFAPLFASAVATDATVISQATGAGTVALTTSNVDARQALITDAAISAAVSNLLNAFFRLPAA